MIGAMSDNFNGNILVEEGPKSDDVIIPWAGSIQHTSLFCLSCKSAVTFIVKRSTGIERQANSLQQGIIILVDRDQAENSKFAAQRRYWLSNSCLLLMSEAWTRKALAAWSHRCGAQRQSGNRLPLNECQLSSLERQSSLLSQSKVSFVDDPIDTRQQASRTASFRGSLLGDTSSLMQGPSVSVASVNPYNPTYQSPDRYTILEHFLDIVQDIPHFRTCVALLGATMILVIVTIVLSGLGFGVVNIKNSYKGEVQPQPQVDALTVQLFCTTPCPGDFVNQVLGGYVNTLSSVDNGNTAFAREVNQLYVNGPPYRVNNCTKISDTKSIYVATSDGNTVGTPFIIDIDCTDANASTVTFYFRLDWNATMSHYQATYGNRIKGHDYIFHTKTLPFVAVVFILTCLAFVICGLALALLMYCKHIKRWAQKHLKLYKILLITCIALCTVACVICIVFLAVCSPMHVKSPSSKRQTINIRLVKSSIAIYAVTVVITAAAAIVTGAALRFARR